MTPAEASARPGLDSECLAAEPGALRWAARLALAAACVVAIAWLVTRTTWYLAIDQFGYLSFARGLAAGRVAYDWPPMRALLPVVAPGRTIDVLAHTYVLHDGELFCRYSPGFPLLLASVQKLIGPGALHFVNAAAFAGLLVAIYAFSARLLGSRVVGAVAALLTFMLPNQLLLWSITPLRDVPTHLVAVSALGLLVWRSDGDRGARPALIAGLLLGIAVTTRVDAILYGIPAAALLIVSPRRSWREAWLPCAVGGLLGILPLLAYDAAATGNPFRPTQAMEIEGALASVSPHQAENGGRREGASSSFVGALRAAVSVESAHAETKDGVRGAEAGPSQNAVMGGGFRIRNLTTSLPANLRGFQGVFGGLGVALGLAGILLSFRSRRVLVPTVSYLLVAIPFFSCWLRPDPRYLAGCYLLFGVLVVAGTRELCALPAAIGTWLDGRGAMTLAVRIASAAILAAAVVALALDTPTEPPASLPWVMRALAAGVCAGLLVAGLRPPAAACGGARVGTAAVMAALLIVLGWRSATGWPAWSSFRPAQVELARQTVEAGTVEGAVILTTDRIGRPAENIGYYTSRYAVHLEDMRRWGLPHDRDPVLVVIDALLDGGFPVYMLSTPEAVTAWLGGGRAQAALASGKLVLEDSRSIAPADAVRWFVASPFHAGLPLRLVKLGRGKPSDPPLSAPPVRATGPDRES